MSTDSSVNNIKNDQNNNDNDDHHDSHHHHHHHAPLTRAERIKQQESEIVTISFLNACKEVLNLILPTILATIFSFGINRTVCMLVVGQYLTSHDIAIYGIGFSFYSVAGCGIPIGFGCAVDLLCSQAAGRGRLDLAGQWLQTGLIVTFLICLPSMILFLFFAGPFLSLFFEKILARDIGTFLQFCTPYILLQAWSLTASRALQAQKRADVPTYASAAGFVGCLITAFLTIPKYGVNAAPICLSFAMIVQLIATFIIAIFFDGETLITKVETWNPIRWFGTKEEAENKLEAENKNEHGRAAPWESSSVGSMERITMYWRIGFPAMLSICSEWFSIEALSLMSSLLVEKEIAALGVSWILMTLFFNIPLSASVASSAFVGNNLGANKPRHAEFYAAVCQTVCAGLLLCTSFFLVACGQWWFSLFAKDQETLYIIYKSLTAIMIFHNVEGWHISLQGIFRGTGEKWLHFTAKVVGVSLWLIALPSAYVCAIVPPSFLVSGESAAEQQTTGVLRMFYGFCVGFVFELIALVYAWQKWIPWKELAIEASKHHDEEEEEMQEEEEGTHKQ